MTDREKVIEWADKCTSLAHESEDCDECPYHLNHEGFYSCIECLLMDTVAMLKEQQTEIEQLRNDANAIRCKDCKHFDYRRLYKCRIHGSLFQPKDGNWFCADGEKADDKK